MKNDAKNIPGNDRDLNKANTFPDNETNMSGQGDLNKSNLVEKSDSDGGNAKKEEEDKKPSSDKGKNKNSK